MADRRLWWLLDASARLAMDPRCFYRLERLSGDWDHSDLLLFPCCCVKSILKSYSYDNFFLLPSKSSFTPAIFKALTIRFQSLWGSCMFAFQTFYSDSYLTHQDPVQTGISPAVPGEAVSVQLLLYLRSSLPQQAFRKFSSEQSNPSHMSAICFMCKAQGSDDRKRRINL